MSRRSHKVGAARRAALGPAPSAAHVSTPSVAMLRRVTKRLRERGGLPEGARLLEWAAETIERQEAELRRRFRDDPDPGFD